VTLLKNGTDSYISEKYPSKTYASVSKLYLADGSSSDTRYAYLYFGVPSGMFGSTILSAKLRLFSGAGWTGSVTLSVKRLATKFTASKVTWNNFPTTAGTAIALTKVSAADGTLWEFDVSTLMQSVANGAAWYGFQIFATNATAKWLYSSNADDKYRPQLEIVWSNAPYAPTVMSPNLTYVGLNKPTLQWDFNDPGGDVTMQAFDLRIFSTLALANANGAGDLLNTTIASSTPECDTSTTAYAGVANNGTHYWRVRVQDGSGLYSQWSVVAQYTRSDKGTLTITNPAAPASNFVTDDTPPFSWTFTGQTQRAYQVLLSTPTAPHTYLWDSGVVTSALTAVTPPAGKITTVGNTYRLTLRIYDTLTRRTTPGDPQYQEQVRDFTYNQSATVATVTGFSVAIDAYRPKTHIAFSRSTAPDFFVIYRDGKVLTTVQPSQVFVSGTAYEFIDYTAKARTSHTWSVAAKVNGVTSTSNPSGSATPVLVTTVLSSLDGTNELFLFNPDVEGAMAEISEAHYVLGNAPPVLITQSLRGYEGTVGGVLLDQQVPGLTIAAQLASIDYFRQNPGQVLKLSWIEKTIQVVCYNLTETSIPYPSGTVDHAFSCSFFQVDF
jgi:hypothetical protein